MSEDLMPIEDIVPKVLDAMAYGEGFDWMDYFGDVIDLDDKTQVALLWHQLRRLASAVSGLLYSMGPDLARMLKEQGSVSFGDALIYAKKKKREVVIDSPGFEEWLKANPDLAAVLFNPNQVRFGQLPQAARETFFEVRWSDEIEVVEASKEFMR